MVGAEQEIRVIMIPMEICSLLDVTKSSSSINREKLVLDIRFSSFFRLFQLFFYFQQPGVSQQHRNKNDDPSGCQRCSRSGFT